MSASRKVHNIESNGQVGVRWTGRANNCRDTCLRCRTYDLTRVRHDGRFAMDIVCSCFQPGAPRAELKIHLFGFIGHECVSTLKQFDTYEDRRSRFDEIETSRLTLVYERTSIEGHVDETALVKFEGSFEYFLQFVWNV